MSYVFVAAGIVRQTKSVESVLDKISIADFAVKRIEDTAPMFLALEESSFVHIPIGIAKDTATMWLVPRPLALVN